MSGDKRKEFGDYQTPVDFCFDVCNYLKDNYLIPSIVLEPTCGIGNFLYASSSIFNTKKMYGIEVNEDYVREAQIRIPNAKIIEGNIFDINLKELNLDKTLIIGNPPWATNSRLVNNLPKKRNFKGLKGIEALTGTSNFDICEYIILKIIEEFKYTENIICMLCKTSVARNVLLEMDRNHIAYQTIEILNFDSNKVFNISASACILIIQLSSDHKDNKEIKCDVKDFYSNTLINTLIVSDGILKNDNVNFDFDGKCQLVWRQGVKHDCSKIMELDFIDGKYYNKQKEIVDIEKEMIYPLVKSSHFKSPILNDYKKYVIVTQRKPKQDTIYIKENYPLTWNYLNKNRIFFERRKSSIYKNSPPFSMFGIGDYSFKKYKVGISGFYKKPLFSLLTSEQPVMTDDTAYFIAFDDYDLAYCLMLLLNSEKVQNFLISIAFLDNKRPYTVKVLSRLDLIKCICNVSINELKETEKNLGLYSYVNLCMYDLLKNYVSEIEV